MKGLPERKFHIYSIIESGLLSLPLTEFLDEIADAGVSIIQLRDKLASNHERYKTANIIKQFIEKKEILFFINDSIDLALACDADGVHLGVKDIPIDIATKKFSELLYGYSCNNLNDIDVANRYADYAGVGPCFYTETKKDIRKILSTDDIKDIVDIATVKTFAIGGIDDTNFEEIKTCGVSGIVLGSYLLQSRTPYETIKKLLDN